MGDYFFAKKVSMDFEKAKAAVTEKLKENGFGVLTEIDVKATLKKKLDVDFKKYTILGACNPNFAYKALTAEDNIGVMLPCNVLVKEAGENETELVAVDPIASMSSIKNESLEGMAIQVQSLLEKVIKEV